MKKIERVVKEVEVVTLLCDLCGSADMARFDCNRRCRYCQREVCNSCYHYEEIRPEMGIMCVRCYFLYEKYQAPINQTYRDRDRLKAEWKAESLQATSPVQIDPPEADTL